MIKEIIIIIKHVLVDYDNDLGFSVGNLGFIKVVF